MGWTPLDGIDVPRWQVFNLHNRGVPEMDVSTMGLDLAKNVFQAHGADASGSVAFRKQLRRDKVLSFFASQPRCVVAMEACGGAHYWARAIGDLGQC